MKIMHVLKHAYENNGHVHMAVDLACAQADAGHQVTFASTRNSYEELLRRHGVRVVDVPEAVGLRAPLVSGWALLRLARDVRPQIVHAHMMSSAVLAHPVAKLTGAVLVTTMHNSFDRHSALMRLGKVVVAVSEAERTALLARGFPARSTVTVLNGPVASAREELREGREVRQMATPCVVSLSGLHARKAVGDIITAFGEALPHAPGWHLNIIGEGPDRERLEELVERSGLGASVHFIGSTPTPWGLLEQADVYASASLDEPFGLSVAEARAAGCAVVATAVGGIPEVLDHGRAGQLVPPSDPSAMAAVLRELMSDPAVLASWQARARDGLEALTVQRVQSDYDRVYRSVL
ncbi:glycosyltransferase [Modestobacter sp. VKM Ac-2986]|uniref:glycosyltransferase n=1 Tax=Modestobacter sp. VKM Ac-2986 TaxID=3004140 RepID=UPI0022AB7DF1|nr:glycosyltransferase [Modestobacter sp. VKM Ac-2986]MCZ2830859.1 glycosyltransferase [Modestobacter sp. VKM Ac-2986]